MGAAKSVNRSQSQSRDTRRKETFAAFAADPQSQCFQLKTESGDQAEEDLREIKMKIELHHIPGEAVAALMDAIREKNKHKEVMKAIKETNDVGQLDDSTTNDLTSFLEERYLRSEDDCRVCYLPLFNLGDTVWSPLRVEMFQRLRRAFGSNKTPSVVERVFRNDYNPEGNKDALRYLVHSLGKRHVLEEEDYGQLLKQPHSSLCIDWDGQCSLLEYAPDTIWKMIYKNESFITFATTNIDRVVHFILTTPNKPRCVERLLQLTVEMKSKDSDKKAVASQILRQLLQDVEFVPHNKEHKHAAIALVEDYHVDPLDKPEGGDVSTVTFATRRGPAFVELSIVLFEYGDMDPKRLEQLINEGISDDALAAIIRSVRQKHPTIQLSRVMKKCARKGHVSSAEELYKLSSKPEDHPFILMVRESATRKPEEKYLRLLKELNPDLYSPQSIIKGENTLHFAAAEGYTDLAKHVLVRGYTNLLWGENHSRMYPIETALANKKFGTAEVLLRGTKDRGQLLKLFKRDGEEKPKISLCELLKKLVDLSKQPKMEDEKNQLLHFILAVLDVTVSEDNVSINRELLEADENGYAPKHNEFRAPSCYDVIAEERLTEIQEHESFSTLVDHKWKEYGAVIQSIPLILHLMFMALLTATLVLAAKSRDPSDYIQDTDWARLSLEVVVILWVTMDLGFKLHGYCTYLNVHITEWNNVLDILGIVFTLLIIPPRVVNNDWQWVFAALAYIFQGLRIFKHAVMIEPVGIYVAVLLLVMKRDLLRFLLLFSVLIISFGGGFYLALRGEMISNGSSNSSSNVSSNASEVDPVNNTSLGLYPYETSEIYYVWLTGFRILTEGSVIGYYGERGFSWLGVIIYWLLLFIVGILLLNILVVQFIHSYEDETGRAQLNVVLTRTRLLHSMEKSYWAKRIIKLMNSRICIKPLFWTRKTVEFIASLFGSECKQKNVKERDRIHMQLQAVEEIVHGIDITLRTQIQEKIDKQETRLELKHEVQTLAADLKSDEVQKLTTDLKSELKHEVQKLATDLKSELKHEVQKLATDLKSELKHEVQKLATDLKSELKHEVQKLTTDLKPLLSDLKALLKTRQPGTPV